MMSYLQQQIELQSCRNFAAIGSKGLTLISLSLPIDPRGCGESSVGGSGGKTRTRSVCSHTHTHTHTIHTLAGISCFGV